MRFLLTPIFEGEVISMKKIKSKGSKPKGKGGKKR